MQKTGVRPWEARAELSSARDQRCLSCSLPRHRKMSDPVTRLRFKVGLGVSSELCLWQITSFASGLRISLQPPGSLWLVSDLTMEETELVAITISTKLWPLFVSTELGGRGSQQLKPGDDHTCWRKSRHRR